MENRQYGRGTWEATATGEERRWWRGCDCVSAGYLLRRAPAWRSSGGQNLACAPLPANVLSQGIEGLEEGHLFQIYMKGSVCQQQLRGDQGCENGLEEK